MGGFDDHVGIVGDWMAPSPSPSPRSFFLAMLGEAASGPVAEPPKDNPTSGFAFHGPDKQFGSENGVFGEQKAASSRSGLVERMAARAGYNAPRLNTDIIRPPADVEKHSPCLTIPPGLSPTAFLDSPVFLSNSLAQPSPTTGKFPFAQNKDNSSDEFNASSFAFKPVLESASVSNKVNPGYLSWQSENRFPSQVIETAENGGLNGNIVQEHHEEDADQTTRGTNGNSVSEDEFNWRKYGQKQVKSSEYPRSYYKCTHADCPVTKKVERSHEGQITEIIYKGTHNHAPPHPNRRSGVGSSNDIQGGPEWRQDGNLEVSSTVVHHGTQFESTEPMDGSLTFSNEEEAEDDDRVTHGSMSLGGDGEGDESESKRRKIEAYTADVGGASRAIREPRVVVQTTSEVDILDDGYRWRKYGQKVVKGNPNPRSYYKCTSTGCTVRKHVERASHDLKSVITTYEGKHNHDVPAARNSSHANSITQPQSVQASQVQNTMARFERPQYSLQPGPHAYGYGMNLTQMAMAGLGPNQAKIQVSGHQFVGHMNEMGMMLPKGEPKVEPVLDPGLNSAANGSSLYHHQIINRLPLGPQM